MSSVSDHVRVYAVVNLRTGRVHGMTCNVNQSTKWVRELIEKYGGNADAATQCVDLVDPTEQDIPWLDGDAAEATIKKRWHQS